MPILAADLWCHFLADVISIPKTMENYRLLYDTKGRFRLHPIRDEDAKVRPILLHIISHCSS
jgi:ribosomal protein S4E